MTQSASWGLEMGKYTAPASSGSGGGDVVDDTSPQLGGNLDLNSRNITGTGEISITGGAVLSGDVVVDTDTLFVDVSEDAVGINTNAPKADMHIKTTGTDADLGFGTNEFTGVGGILVECNANHSANSAPIIAFYRNGGNTQAAGNMMANVLFVGEDDGNTATIYGQWKTWTNKASDGTESYAMGIQGLVGGTNRAFINCLGAVDDAGVANDYGGLLGPEIVLNQHGVDIDFRVESDNNVQMLFVDAGNDRVGIGTSTPITALDVASGSAFRSTRLLTVAVSSNTTLSEANHAGRDVFVTGSSRGITLPDNQGAGVPFTLLSNDANGFTLRTGTGGSDGDNMNGSQADITVDGRNGVTCISTGTDYVVLGA